MTSNTQTPKQDWLNIVTTSKARTKIRRALKEMVARQHAFAKETLERKFKNRKLEYDEATMMRPHQAFGIQERDGVLSTDCRWRTGCERDSG